MNKRSGKLLANSYV